MEILNASTTSSKSNQLRNVNTVRWESRNVTAQPWEIKADMKSYIPLETAVIFFLANPFPKQGISSEYVTVDFICMG